MNHDATPLLETANGIAYHMNHGTRTLLGFEGAWMALTREQMLGVGNTLANILNCPFKSHHLDSGLLLRSRSGDYRLALTEDSAKELHGLINDTLLLLEAESALSGTFPAKTMD